MMQQQLMILEHATPAYLRLVRLSLVIGIASTLSSNSAVNFAPDIIDSEPSWGLSGGVSYARRLDGFCFVGLEEGAMIMQINEGQHRDIMPYGHAD